MRKFNFDRYQTVHSHYFNHNRNQKVVLEMKITTFMFENNSSDIDSCQCWLAHHFFKLNTILRIRGTEVSLARFTVNNLEGLVSHGFASGCCQLHFHFLGILYHQTMCHSFLKWVKQNWICQKYQKKKNYYHYTNSNKLQSLLIGTTTVLYQLQFYMGPIHFWIWVRKQLNLKFFNQLNGKNHDWSEIG